MVGLVSVGGASLLFRKGHVIGSNQIILRSDDLRCLDHLIIQSKHCVCDLVDNYLLSNVGLTKPETEPTYCNI